MVRVFIADDHAVVRQGLKQIISEAHDMQVVGEAGSGHETLQLLKRSECNVVLLDISMPDRNGIDTLKQIRKNFPDLAVLMLSMHPEDQYAIRALKAGAAGYLSKHCAPSQLVAAIRQVAKGKKCISPALSEQLLTMVVSGERPVHETLSDREYQTMILIASGKTLAEIAAELCLSAKTVSVYRARVLEKMKLKNNTELAYYAIRNRLVE